MEKEFYIVGIGASAGGLVALREFFDHIPAETSAAFIVVTHLNRKNYSVLSDLLATHTPLPIARVDKDLKIDSGNIYVLTENTALTVENDWLKVSARDEKIINSSVDVFFKSLATQFKERAIGIILSGGGSDGLEGALQLAESGGKVMVQNLRTAQVTGMPASIIDHDHPSDILNPTKLAEKVIQLCQARTDQTSLNDQEQKSIATPGGSGA